ncbi:MAG: ABC transporter ATP-binding protein [Chloroflexota bacterium]
MPDSAINLINVNKTLGGRSVLRDVNFAVEPGDIFGYLGPNGAGKTTTIRIILGLLQAGSGRVSILGQDASVDKTRARIGFVLESDGLYDNMTAYNNIGFFAKIYSLASPAERIEQVLRLGGLSDRAGDKVGTYSKGMRQRLALARAMVHNPEILILDEPTAGVDPSGQIEVRQIILDMAHKEGKTIFLSSHNLDEVQRICNRIALIARGEIRLYGELDKMQHEMSKGEVAVETATPVNEPVLTEMQNLPEVSLVSQQDKTIVLSVGKVAEVADIINFLAQRNVKIEQIRRKEASLEEIYTSIVREAERK